jgi:hypothetical protein
MKDEPKQIYVDKGTTIGSVNGRRWKEKQWGKIMTQETPQ